MEIPIQNIYYLLCYAWNMLEEGNIVDIKELDSNELIDLYAKVLSNGVGHLLKRGIDRNYVLAEEDIRTIKGKLDIGYTYRHNLTRVGKTHCHFDELSHNITHNRILKSTICFLISSDDLDEKSREELIRVYDYFHQVEKISITSKLFRQVHIHRNNSFYHFLMDICELIFENMFINQENGKTKFRDFLQDEKRMWKVFQSFVKNFYLRTGNFDEVKSEIINWNITADDKSLLPIMMTDVSMRINNRKIIIDTKYYKEALQINYDKQTIISGNLFQLYSYLKQEEYKNECSLKTEGILLYPAVDSNVDFKGEIEGHKIKVQTLNLNQNWRDIETDLYKLVN